MGRPRARRTGGGATGGSHVSRNSTMNGSMTFTNTRKTTKRARKRAKAKAKQLIRNAVTTAEANKRWKKDPQDLTSDIVERCHTNTSPVIIRPILQPSPRIDVKPKMKHIQRISDTLVRIKQDLKDRILLKNASSKQSRDYFSFAKAFRDIDLNSDGELDLDEFVYACGPKRMNLGMPERDVLKLFNEFSEGNTVIHVSQFLSGMADLDRPDLDLVSLLDEYKGRALSTLVDRLSSNGISHHGTSSPLVSPLGAAGGGGGGGGGGGDASSAAAAEKQQTLDLDLVHETPSSLSKLTHSTLPPLKTSPVRSQNNSSRRVAVADQHSFAIAASRSTPNLMREMSRHHSKICSIIQYQPTSSPARLHCFGQAQSKKLNTELSISLSNAGVRNSHRMFHSSVKCNVLHPEEAAFDPRSSSSASASFSSSFPSSSSSSFSISSPKLPPLSPVRRSQSSCSLPGSPSNSPWNESYERERNIHAERTQGVYPSHKKIGTYVDDFKKKQEKSDNLFWMRDNARVLGKTNVRANYMASVLKIQEEAARLNPANGGSKAGTGGAYAMRTKMGSGSLW